MKKFTESLSTIKKEPLSVLNYYDLFPLLKGLESERPGIKDRVWKWMCGHPPYGGWDDFKDVAFQPYNGRISFINLFCYGVGDEYSLKYLKDYPDELEHCRKIHPEAFEENSKESEIRKDLNLIWHVYESDIDNDSIGKFAVMVSW